MDELSQTVVRAFSQTFHSVTLPTHCDQCRKGWIPDGGWYQPCPICEGFGELTLTRLSKLMDLDEATLKGIWTMKRKTRKKTALKVLEAFVRLTQPKRPKLFA